MLRRISTSKLCWLCVSIFLFAATFASHAAPPHPRLFLRQFEGAIKPMMRVMGANTLQMADPDIPKQGYRPQPDGVEYILAILIDFSDQPGQRPVSAFDEALFGTSGTSLRLYYQEVSYGQMHVLPGYLNGVVPRERPWYRASKPMSYYGLGAGTVMIDRVEKLVTEACAAADAEVDFSRYDRDKDGTVDHLMVIHAGDDEAVTGVPEDIWSVVIDRVPGIYDGVGIASAMIVAEDPGSEFIDIGIYCHEFFHEFGAPDLYNYRWDHPVGHWCLMGAKGPYQDDGQHPCHICGYLKWDFDAEASNGAVGWLKPIELTSHGVYSVDSFELPQGNRLYKIDIPGKLGKEYFLIENRSGAPDAIYDTYLPEYGMLIWHIDERQPKSFGNPSRAWVEDPSDPDHSSSIRPTEGAAYSADDGQTSFTPATQPDSSTNDGEYTGIIVTDIGPEGTSMSFTFFSGDTYEPNDSIDDAYGLLVYGRQYTSFLRDEEEIDFYKFRAFADGNVLIYLKDIPEKADYDLQVFDSQGASLGASIDEGRTEEILTFKPRTSGIYYVAVSSEDGYSSNQAYSLTVDAIPLAPRTIAVSNVYPNPGPGSDGYIWVDYKLLDLVERLTLDIYTPAGTPVYTNSISDVGRTGRFFWNARTESDEKLASGVYIYVLKAELNGETDVKTGKIAIVYGTDRVQ